MRKELLAFLLLAAFGSPAFAQTVAVTPTTSAAILTLDPITVPLSSVTSVTAPVSGVTQTVCVADREVMEVRGVTGTNVSFTRGRFSTRAATHISGITLVCANPASVFSFIPSGQCTRTSVPYVPWIVGGGPGLGGEVGSIYDCLGVTTAGQWVRVDSNDKPIVGSTVASPNGVMTLTGSFVKVSGANAVTGITVPAGTMPGFTFVVEPTGAFTTTNATNIQIASTAVVGKILTFTWDGAKWNPSY